jgi:hypothetical protein
MDGWPIFHSERVPLDYEFLTPGGMYYQGYIEGQKGRNLKETNTDNIPEEFIKGIEDGYGDWLRSIGGVKLTRGPIVAGVPFNWQELFSGIGDDDSRIKFGTKDWPWQVGDILKQVKLKDDDFPKYVWDPNNTLTDKEITDKYAWNGSVWDKILEIEGDYNPELWK